MNRRRMMLQGQEDDGMKEWRLINKVVLDSDSREIVIDTDSDGQPFELSDFVMNVVAMNTGNGNNAAHVWINGHEKSSNAFLVPKMAESIPVFWQALVWNCGAVIMSANGAGAYGSRNNTFVCCQPEYLNWEKIQEVKLQMASANVKFCAGATVTLWGR